jgi:hypothetical protein
MSKVTAVTTREHSINAFAEQMFELDHATKAARYDSIPALRLIANTIERYPTSGQVKRLTAFLAAVYNGYDYQFAPKDLRELDRELCTACLAVLAYDHFGVEEIQTLGVFSADDLHRWIKREGIERIHNME